MASLGANRAILVVDAPADLQEWVDALVESGRQGGPGWPLPAHSGPLPTVAVSVAFILSAVEQLFTKDLDPWSVTRYGLPPITVGDRTYGGSVEPDADPAGGAGEPHNNGSRLHKLAHLALGNFHS